ncbi:MAG TPA: glutathione S-transferase [Polyangiaceae bacterium]|nr:glutathione S-transferase [Polyangiaceae bacterium]
MESELLLYVWDYNYSSWSMRAGLALRQTGATFRELSVHAEGADTAALKALSPTGRFPLLKHGSELIWDSLAIGEYLHEQFPNAGLWPSSSQARAHARSMVAEMHSSFGTLRDAMPMNIRRRYREVPKTPAVRADIARISQMWRSCLDRFGGNGPFLFGEFSLADAFFAPVVMRFVSYDAQLSSSVATYAEAVQNQPFVKDWIARAHTDPRRADYYEYER